MKLLSLTLSVCIMFASLICSGQRSNADKGREKTKAFNTLPARFPAHQKSLEQLFSLTTGDSVNIEFNRNFILNGIVTDRVHRSNDLESINIKPSDDAGVLYTFSRIRRKDGQILFTGRALHRNVGDVLLLTRKDGDYYFEKKQANTIIAE